MFVPELLASREREREVENEDARWLLLVDERVYSPATPK